MMQKNVFLLYLENDLYTWLQTQAKNPSDNMEISAIVSSYLRQIKDNNVINEFTNKSEDLLKLHKVTLFACIEMLEILKAKLINKDEEQLLKLQIEKVLQKEFPGIADALEKETGTKAIEIKKVELEVAIEENSLELER